MGRVLGPDGKPAGGAAVWAEEKTAEMYARPNTKTDAKGEFRFEGADARHAPAGQRSEDAGDAADDAGEWR